MNRCTKCILPSNYPGITFNKSGICNHCIAYKERTYLGNDALKEKITSFLKTKTARNYNYDCILGLSGGRDSTYLLYYLVKVLGLNVLAYSLDSGFIPQQTKTNIIKMADQLGVTVVIEKHNYLRKCFRHHILSWIHKPSPAMIGMLCTGCRIGIDLGIYNFAKRNNIPVVMTGATPVESIGGYKQSLMRLNPNSMSAYSFIAGYLYQVISNPRWLLDPTCLIIQGKEYYYHFLRKARKTKELMYIAPFYSFKRWQEKEIVSTIETELNWKKHPDSESSWRGDCEIAILKSFLYKKTLGFNDNDDNLSCLIMDKQITREEALNRLEKEGDISEKIIKGILSKYEIPFSHLKRSYRHSAR